MFLDLNLGSTGKCQKYNFPTYSSYFFRFSFHWDSCPSSWFSISEYITLFIYLGRQSTFCSSLPQGLSLVPSHRKTRRKLYGMPAFLWLAINGQFFLFSYDWHISNAFIWILLFWNRKLLPVFYVYYSSHIKCKI